MYDDIMQYIGHDLKCFFFFNDTATTEIYTLSLHDALPIPGRVPDSTRPKAVSFVDGSRAPVDVPRDAPQDESGRDERRQNLRDRKSTRLNSSHANISYAVFCLKKKKQKHNTYLSPSYLPTH